MSVFIRKNILNFSLSWSKSSETNPWHRLLCFSASRGFTHTAWKVSKYGVFYGPYFLVFRLNTGNTDQKKFRIWTLFTQSQHFPFLVFETMLCFLLCSINCEHAATTQRAPIFFVSISLLLPILLPHVVCLYFIKNFFWSSVFKFVI